MSNVAYFRFNVTSDLPDDIFEQAMFEADIELSHQDIEHTELIAADLPFVVIRAQLARSIDEDELQEVADDLDCRVVLDGEPLSVELDEPSLEYIEA